MERRACDFARPAQNTLQGTRGFPRRTPRASLEGLKGRPGQDLEPQAAGGIRSRATMGRDPLPRLDAGTPRRREIPPPWHLGRVPEWTIKQVLFQI